MQAVILAAGRGSRLGKMGRDRPKCLLEVGRRPLIEHQLETLAEAGVAPVAMVVGYCADEIKEVVGLRVEYIENPRWSVTNSLYSFELAKDWVAGGVVVLNADVLFHPNMLDRLLSTEGDAFAFDSLSGDAREHMKVDVKDGRLVDMSKTMTAGVAGENVGLLKFTPETAKRLFERARSILDEGHEKDWLGSAVRAVAKETRVEGVDIAGLPWGEIDSPYDLARVRKQVYPAIRKSARRTTTPWRVARWALGSVVAAFLSFSVFQAWVAPPELVWESAAVTGLEPALISADGREQRWWMLDNRAQAAVNVAGPGSLRIETRPLLGSADEANIVVPGGHAKFPYVFEVRIDGKRLGWYRRSEPQSNTWKHEGWRVGQRDKTSIKIPPGNHRIGVRLVASTSGRALLRLRQVAGEEEEEGSED